MINDKLQIAVKLKKPIHHSLISYFGKCTIMSGPNEN